MEELDQNTLLETLKDYPVGERVILGNFGTVQTLLCLIFNSPIVVEMRDQVQRQQVMYGRDLDWDTCDRMPLSVMRDPKGIICRKVGLKTADGRLVCLATSRIPMSLNHPHVIEEIQAGQTGLGQIIMHHNVQSRRHISHVDRDEIQFSRRYEITATGIFMEITEIFIRRQFAEVKWV